MKELIIKVERKYEDKLEGILSIYGIDSYEIIDSDIYKEFDNTEKNWDYIDESITNHSDYIEFKCYLENSDDIKEYIKNSCDFIVEFSEKEIKDTDYENDWKKYFKTIFVSDDLIVEPKWDVKSKNSIIINPGMAFGTGSHETTFLMLKEIDHIKPSGKVLDIGTGSGILAIAAAKTFGCNVDAYEIDELAIKSAKENIELNNVSDKIHLIKKDFREDDVVLYDFIFSNIYAETLADMMDGFSKRIKNEGIIILSGIMNEKSDLVKNAMEENNFKIISEESLNEWTRLTGVKIG